MVGTFLEVDYLSARGKSKGVRSADTARPLTKTKETLIIKGTATLDQIQHQGKKEEIFVLSMGPYACRYSPSC